MGVRRRWFTFWDNGLLSVIRHDLVRPCMQWQNKPSEQLNSNHPHFILLLVRQSTLIRLVARVAARLASLLWHIVSHFGAAPPQATGNYARRIKDYLEFGMI